MPPAEFIVKPGSREPAKYKVFHEAFARKCGGCDEYLYLCRISELKKVLNGTTRSRCVSKVRLFNYSSGKDSKLC